MTECLVRHRDATGRPAVMTLGLTLSLPDSQAMRAEGFPLPLTPQLTTPPPHRPPYADILAAIREGIDAGVFTPQLHGMAHYWPDTLMRAGQTDPNVRRWILSGPGQETESLPSPLQSRWTDASVLPSRPLPDTQVRDAVAEEVALYRQIFGAKPGIVVPPTFVWTPFVESAWAAQGVRCIVTPGRRHTARNANGQPDSAQTSYRRKPVSGFRTLVDSCLPRKNGTATEPGIHNGQTGIGGITYLVRDRYFEPARGHRAEQGLAALAEKSLQDRPCLLETHRFIFTGEGEEDALEKLDSLLTGALANHPALRFMSAAELAQCFRSGGDALETSTLRRFAVWVRRMQGIPRFARLARYTGLSLGRLFPS